MNCIRVTGARAALVVMVCAVSPVFVGAGPTESVEGRPGTSAPKARASRTEAVEKVDAGEASRRLLGDEVTLGQRLSGHMGRSAIRLARDRDTGAGTQEIQRRIVDDIDRLIEMELKRKKQPPCDKPGCPGEGPPKPGDPAAPAPAGGPPKPNASAAAADKSETASAGKPRAGGTEFAERAEAFVRISPRLVGPVMEGASEQVSEKYRSMTEAYYRGVASARD